MRVDLLNSKINLWFDKHEKLVVSSFFVLFLVIGLSVFSDYGISWDESINRQNGLISFNYVFNGDDKLISYVDRDYGVAFELPLVALEKVFVIEDSRNIFLMRHLVTFLFFYLSVFFFYLIKKNYFKNWKIGLFAAFILVLNPRIFAHSFYNSKDLVFLSMFIISIYTLIRFLQEKNIKFSIIHAFASAVLIDIRIVGIFIPFFTMVFFVLEFFYRKKSRSKIISASEIYLLSTMILTIFLWPYLWKDPLHNIVQAFQNISHFRWNWSVLYLGKLIPATQLPWHYIPVWIFITTPIMYIISFIIGLFFLARDLSKKFVFNSERTKSILILLWFFFPLLIVLIMSSVVYDSWRHLFFIYPALIIISVQGIIGLLYKYKKKPYVHIFIIAILILSFFNTAFFMIKNHPYQNVYFNEVVSLKPKYIEKSFELDYWGLSYKQALDFLAEYDTSNRIKIVMPDLQGKITSKILIPEIKNKFIYFRQLENADYLVTNYRRDVFDHDSLNEIYFIKVNGVKILSVFELDN